MDKAYLLAPRQQLNGNRGLACDVDNTITLTTPSVFAAMDRVFARGVEDRDLSIEDMVRKYSHGGGVPYWQSPIARQYHEALIRQERFYRSLPVIEGAQESLRRLADNGLLSSYITARPERMTRVTGEYLHSFPSLPIIAKPDQLDFEDNHPWKAEVLRSLYPLVPGIIDDDKGLLEALPEDYPGVVLLFGADHVEEKHGRRVYACKDWEAVERAVHGLSDNIITPAYR